VAFESAQANVEVPQVDMTSTYWESSLSQFTIMNHISIIVTISNQFSVVLMLISHSVCR